MPIRYRDQQTRLGQIATALAGASSVFAGTNVPPVARTGMIAAQLAGASAVFSGNYSSAPNRTGVIGTTLSGATALFLSGFFGSWTIPNQSFVQGVAATRDLTAYVPGYYFGMDLVLNGSLPTGVTWNGTSLVYDGVAPSVTVTGISISIVAED